MADEIVDEDGETWIPHYRFPVNNQSAHTIFSIQENPSIRMIVDRASKHTGVDFNHVVVLLYRDGSTNDVGEVPNRIENEGVEAFASVLKTSTTLRILDFTYNGIQQRGIASLAKAIIENTSLCYCNLEQVGVPHNEFSRELIRKIVKRNYLSLDGDAKKEVDDLLSPPHLDEILSVYRIA